MASSRPLGLALPHRFTREDYHAMAEAGILGEDDRVELIAGQIVAQMPIGTAHISMVNRLNHLFSEVARGQCIVSVQNPIALNAFNEPEPDIALLRPRADFYSESPARLEDILLVIQVADSSLAFDREEKIPMYAMAGLPAVWLVDLVGKAVIVYAKPSQGEYLDVTPYRRTGSITIPDLQDASISLADLGF